jgi:hypothetical protein
MFSFGVSLGSIEESQVEVCDAAGMCKKVARIRPLGVIKGWKQLLETRLTVFYSP